MFNRRVSKPELIFIVCVLLAVLLLALLPTGFPSNAYPNSTRAAARVLEVNNANISSTVGFIFQGEQICKVRILNGPFKGQESEARNRFVGRLELDKAFEEGDKALVVIDYNEQGIRHVNIIDHYRVDLEAILFGLFAVFLIMFARWTGAKALLSFVLTVLLIWKFLIPLLLKGWNPIIISLVFVIIVTVVVLLLVGGLNRKSLAAIIGSLSGTILTGILAIIFGNLFKIHGAVLPHAESLLYAGYAHLNLTEILIAVVFIASAGALMDVAIDIAASVNEIVEKNPDISTADAIRSGFNIGRAVVGTMTTTLLFAYTGGYIALLMVFMAQGTPIVNIVNLKYVSKEIMHTVVGSIGLVAVAPLTAIWSGILLTRKSTPTPDRHKTIL
ncbi:MAG: YibE/F family protein [Bacillota bacterium]